MLLVGSALHIERQAKKQEVLQVTLEPYTLMDEFFDTRPQQGLAETPLAESLLEEEQRRARSSVGSKSEGRSYG